MNVRKWLVTLFGSGLSPVAPGTAGSLLTIILAAVGYGVLGHFGCPSPALWNGVLVAGLVVWSVVCVWLGEFAVEYFGRKDPGPCVVDEAAGICLTLLFQPMLPGMREGWVLGAAFLAFRLFDITKPPPARQLERLPAGWGILMDDLAAAVYANLLCQLLLRLALSHVS